ncbi:MAG: TIGR04211 family SH3 domain-containing protein [Gammaproteobacteria bacterium]|nr:TIGR04211 family SH3 domain-containing protein [Gammaproteobacteria bacterium]
MKLTNSKRLFFISISVVFSLMIVHSPFILAAAHRAYVIDQAYLQVRSGPGNEYPILKSLPNGSPVTVITDDIGGGYSELKLKSGIKGYAVNRYLSSQPVNQQTAPKPVELPDSRHQKKSEPKSRNPADKALHEQIQTLTMERDQLKDELVELKKHVSGSMDVERQRNNLQERLVNLERSNRHLKLENQALQDKSSHDWFLLGAGVLFAGVLIGWLFASLGNRKKSAWESF